MRFNWAGCVRLSLLLLLLMVSIITVQTFNSEEAVFGLTAVSHAEEVEPSSLFNKVLETSPDAPITDDDSTVVDFRQQQKSYIWIDKQRLLNLPVSGAAWDNLMATAHKPAAQPDLSNQDDSTNVRVLARALVYARTGEESFRRSVIDACMAAIGTEEGGRTLDLGKELAAYVLAADLVGLPAREDARFRHWLAQLRHRKFPSGKSLVSTHERRPNNWGTFAGASRLVIAVYLGDREDVTRSARVFKGWLGDRDAYRGFLYRDLSWQADAGKPVGINPVGATREGHSIDGVLPDDQRRGGRFVWPPPKENYVYSALQGALVQAIILHRLGYPVWEWQDKALLRAFNWLYKEAGYAAVGDDGWQPYVINYYYNTDFAAPLPASPGKNAGWTDWTHGSSFR